MPTSSLSGFKPSMILIVTRLPTAFCNLFIGELDFTDCGDVPIERRVESALDFEKCRTASGIVYLHTDLGLWLASENYTDSSSSSCSPELIDRRPNTISATCRKGSQRSAVLFPSLFPVSNFGAKFCTCH